MAPFHISDGDYFKAIRYVLKLTQDEFGEALGMTRPHHRRKQIGRWESGQWPVPGPILCSAERLLVNEALKRAWQEKNGGGA